MTVRFTKADFEKMGEEPCRQCYGPMGNTNTGEGYYVPCAYHEGYFDAFNQFEGCPTCREVGKVHVEKVGK